MNTVREEGVVEPRLVVALDVPDEPAAMSLLDRLDPALCRIKVGKELFTRTGPALVERIHARGFSVFLDLKFHDIPNTVAAACRAAADLGVWMMNVHALGGRRMLEAASQALAREGPRPLLTAVTVLTSLERGDLSEMGIDVEPASLAARLSAISAAAGCDGVVCSAREAARFRSEHGPGFVIVTPGIRLPDSPADDQRRTLTPVQAIEAGASYLVVGRPVIGAEDPGRALREIATAIDRGGASVS